MNTTKLELEDGPAEIIYKMSEGVPGAIAPLVELLTLPPQYGVSVVLSLDAYGIYGSDLYVLWNDIAERNIWRFVALIKAVSLGVLPKTELVAATQRGSVQLIVDMKKLYLDVQKHMNADIDESSSHYFPDYA